MIVSLFGVSGWPHCGGEIAKFDPVRNERPNVVNREISEVNILYSAC